jgi:hypothetical protein
MIHNIESFAEKYRAISDDELTAVASQRDQLVEDAVLALDAEVKRREIGSKQSDPLPEPEAESIHLGETLRSDSRKWGRILRSALFAAALSVAAIFLASSGSMLFPDDAAMKYALLYAVNPIHVTIESKPRDCDLASARCHYAPLVKVLNFDGQIVGGTDIQLGSSSSGVPIISYDRGTTWHPTEVRDRKAFEVRVSWQRIPNRQAETRTFEGPPRWG